ncbi:hypothetical protein C0075_10620 [Rhizobium sp. KAs_5_22]|uniref:hypothetical protein n=1 Tax=Ciceribacter selenitireducens TaxID=448181 RepID=UPI00048F0E1C|nr:hypothetical protein [Ciceribacter selenitireducens]PPJ46147.1 hypothetical protein C0075_10620 [Rhizobium sp. KAs_5_22]
MNNAIKIALASVLALGSVSGGAFAQTAAVTAEQNVSVIRIDSLNNDAGRSEYDRLTQMSSNQAGMAEAQAMVSADPMLVAALESQNVQLTNVVHVQTAANGGKVVYVR